MSELPENPFASPRVVDSYVDVLSEQADPPRDAPFATRWGLIVGDSPLSLPAVCIYCGEDLVADSGERKFAKFVRTQMLKGSRPLEFKVSYSVCPACVADGGKWRRRRNVALYSLLWLLALALSVLLFAVVFALPGNEDVVGLALFTFFSSMGTAGLLTCWICELQLPKHLTMSGYQGNSFRVHGAGRGFLRRFRADEDRVG